jgi:hypothetical protein
MYGENDRGMRPERRGIGGGVNDVDPRPAGRSRNADKRPAKIGGRVRRLCDAMCSGRNRTRILPAEGDELDCLVERQQRAGQPPDVATDAGGGGRECTPVNPDSKQPGSFCYRISM